MHDWRKSGKTTKGTIARQSSTSSKHSLDSCQAFQDRPFHPPKPLDQRSQFCLSNLPQFLHARSLLFSAGATLHLGALSLVLGQFLIPRNFDAANRHRWSFRFQVLGSWMVAVCFLVAMALLLKLPRQLRRFDRHVPFNRSTAVVCDNRDYHVADQTHLYVGIAMLTLPAAIVTTTWALLMTCLFASPGHEVPRKAGQGLSAPLLGAASDDEGEETGVEYARSHPSRSMQSAQAEAVGASVY
jgi:hypothetical protein